MKLNYTKGDVKLELEIDYPEFKNVLAVLDDNGFEVPTLNKLFEYIMLTAINNNRKVQDASIQV